MGTLLLTTTPSSETVATKKGKTVGELPATGKVDKAPAAKRDRKAAPATKDAPVIVKTPSLVLRTPRWPRIPQ